MYHISKDARARKSATLICNAVLELAQTKKLDYINVSDIQKQSTVSRSTFYRLFDNIMDVLAYMCDQMVDATTRKADEIFESSRREAMLSIISNGMENSALLQVLVENNHVDILYRSYLKHAEDIVKQVDSDLTTDDAVAQYLIHDMPIFVSSMFHTWVSRGQRETPEELYEIFKKCFSYGAAMFGAND
ncbi:MAG: TetR/AcrR family transcriptional regulator [Coriobacteriales bacterium]|nr:TetR/AcrR family transcriptional regulator [Coriobacteriales bacterium]